MAQLYIDRIDNLGAEEVHGVVRSLTRKARLLFTSTEVAQNPSHDILAAALTVLDAAGYTSMSTLSAWDDPTQRWGALTLVRRRPAMAFSDSHNCVDVVLEYQHLLDGPNQDFQPGVDYGAGAAQPPIMSNGVVFGKGRCSIVDKTTNFYYPNGDKTRQWIDPTTGLPTNKVQILVAHKFPLWETGITAASFDKNYPRTIFQGGEISIPFPQSNYGFSLIVNTADPTSIANYLVASINLVPLLGQPALTWICSEVRWECNAPAGSPFDPIPSYNMSFEFQNNSDGWDPTVAFIDHRTGRPPSGIEFPTDLDFNGVMSLVADPSLPVGAPFRLRPAGLWQVPALRRVDFVGYFNTLFR